MKHSHLSESGPNLFSLRIQAIGLSVNGTNATSPGELDIKLEKCGQCQAPNHLSQVLSYPSHPEARPWGCFASLVEGLKLSTCEQHRGLPCGETAWVSEQGPCCFLTGDLKHSWVVTRSCSGTLSPTGARLI